MSIFFDVSEILQFAIRIEENGEKFYRYAVQITDNDDAREMFNHLADEEVKHKKVFENLLSKTKGFVPVESYPSDYFGYLRSYVDKIIFTKEMLDNELSDVKNTLSAIDFGIQRELDSILYYHDIKKFVPENHYETINKIIDEERKHFSDLSRARLEFLKRSQ